MFAKACEMVSKFTRPVVVSTRTVDGKVTTSTASYVILNSDGWIVTAGHVYHSFVKFQADRNKINEVNEKNAKKLAEDPNTTDLLKLEPDWITNHSFWWGRDGVRLTDATVDLKLDIAIGRLDPYVAPPDIVYPKIRDPESLRPGTSLCKAGFAFSELKCDFDPEHNAFRLNPIALPLFPLEGMHTRDIILKSNEPSKYERRYVETSSPGLKGQSGGPIFDKDGNIYAIQVQTTSQDIGLHPSLMVDGGRVIENQFLNLGIGLHPKILMQILDDKKIRYSRSDDSDGYRIIC